MPEPEETYEDAPRRTHLAAERTQLAWWRTGLTAIAVGLGVGRVVPDLAGTVNTWPYVITGIGFALYGVALIAYGTARARELERNSAAATGSTPRTRCWSASPSSAWSSASPVVALIAIQ